MDRLREKFTLELKKLEGEVLKMGNIVYDMLKAAIEAYKKREEGLADKVISMDDIVDGFNLEIEKKCLELIALQQPMAKDLRVIASVMRAITDIERMGDYVVDITKFVKRLCKEPLLSFASSIPKMADVVEKMLKETLEAFVKRDLKAVQSMIDHDKIVDNSFKEIFSDVLAAINKDASVAATAIYTLMIARYLERIADHITNVGERIFYIETGELKELHV